MLLPIQKLFIDMARLNEINLLVTGRIVEINPGTGLPEEIVYQRTSALCPNLPPLAGRPMQRRAYVIPFDPQTPEQLVCRAKFAAGVAAWQSLPINDKIVFNRRASKRNMTGFNLFLKDYMKAP